MEEVMLWVEEVLHQTGILFLNLILIRRLNQFL